MDTGQYAAGPWISVNDKLPEERRYVMILAHPYAGCGDEYTSVWGKGYINNGKWYCEGIVLSRSLPMDEVTHWAEVRM